MEEITRSWCTFFKS